MFQLAAIPLVFIYVLVSPERRVALEREMKRLGEWSETLRIRRRDLLKCDVEAARAYDRDAIAYNAALAKANEDSMAVGSLASR